MTIKEVKQRLCANCTFYSRQVRTFPIGIDDNRNILYKQWASRCLLKPITKDGKECPYFKRVQNGNG